VFDRYFVVFTRFFAWKSKKIAPRITTFFESNLVFRDKNIVTTS